jgi:hypothetical protein
MPANSALLVLAIKSLLWCKIDDLRAINRLAPPVPDSLAKAH